MVNEQTIKAVMAAVFEVSETEISNDSSMDSIESWDSLKHMNLVIALEEEFGVIIPDEDAADITSYALIKAVLDEFQGA